MMVGVEDVERWGGELRVLQSRFGRYFERKEPRQRAIAYLKGLLSDVPRKNGWQLAEQEGEATPDGMQRLLNTSVWQVEGVRDALYAYVNEHLGTPAGVLVVDETGFLKKGTKSVGVKRQYSGTAGRIENCQIGVILAYAGEAGYVLLDRELYLPKEWAADTARREEADVPATVSFSTKPELGRQMLERAFAAAVPCAWVTGDTIYGGDRAFRLWLEQRQQPFVLAVPKNEALWAGFQQVQAEILVASVPGEAWQRLSAGDGAKGPRLYDWALVPLPRFQQADDVLHALLVRRSLSDPTERAYYVVFAPANVTLQTLVEVAGQRWKVEECFELAKNEVGLDHDEVRHWTGWYRHITLAMWALAFLTVTRAEVMAAETKKAASPAGNAALVSR